MISRNKLIVIKEAEYDYNIKASNSQVVAEFIQNVIKLQEEPEEVLICITLDTKNNVNGYFEVARGAGNATYVSLPELFKRVLISNCKKFIIAHNHPSGDATPSSHDIELTKSVVKGAETLDLQLLDSLVIGDKDVWTTLKYKI